MKILEWKFEKFQDTFSKITCDFPPHKIHGISFNGPQNVMSNLSYRATQWAAVRIQVSLIIDPPQVWRSLRRNDTWHSKAITTILKKCSETCNLGVQTKSMLYVLVSQFSTSQEQ